MLYNWKVPGGVIKTPNLLMVCFILEVLSGCGRGVCGPSAFHLLLVPALTLFSGSEAQKRRGNTSKAKFLLGWGPQALHAQEAVEADILVSAWQMLPADAFVSFAGLRRWPCQHLSPPALFTQEEACFFCVFSGESFPQFLDLRC